MTQLWQNGNRRINCAGFTVWGREKRNRNTAKVEVRWKDEKQERGRIEVYGLRKKK